MLDENKINTNRIAICLPSDACYTRIIEIPEEINEDDSREFLENPDKKRLRPIHKLNHSSAEAFKNINIRLRRKLVRRKFVLSIGAAWGITVPASAFLAAFLFFALQYLI